MIKAEDMVPVAQVARCTFTCVDVAKAAAANRAEGVVARCVLADNVNNEIVLGHMFVAVYYGSSEALDKLQAAIATLGGIKPL